MADSGDHDPLIEALAQYRKPQPELRAGDPAVFREPTLLNMLLGRYAPSGLLASYYQPETREGAASARRWGGLMDDVFLSLLGIRSPRGADTATGAMLDKRAEQLGTYGDDIMKAGVDWPSVLARGYGGMRSTTSVQDAFDPVFSGARSGNFYRGPKEPANMNNSLQIDDSYVHAGIDKAWNDLVRRSRLQSFDVIPGGRKD